DSGPLSGPESNETAIMANAVRPAARSAVAGLETVGSSYYLLDETALGRQEDWEEPKDRAASARAAVPDFSTWTSAPTSTMRPRLHRSTTGSQPARRARSCAAVLALRPGGSQGQV
ncbi:MAG: hypothetical protein ACRDUV_06970, partial [Pseudonocardiaceae bacterium]